MQQQQFVFGTPVPPRSHPRRTTTPTTPADPAQQLREALQPYLDLKGLQILAAQGGNIREALIAPGDTPAEVYAMLDAVAAVLRPIDRVQVKSPACVAALLLAEMSYLDQEHLRVIVLDTKNRVQKIQTVYVGSLNSAAIRVGEVFKEALRLNACAIIIAHNHPSGDPTPSPEDVLVTRQIVEAGKLLDVDVTDHLVIGQGRWVSLRERGLGFPK